MTTENKPPKRDVDGILLLDKPLHLSSNTALQIVKRLFHAKKAGHTGSLDPLATGLLPICLGEATKFSQYLLAADKTYAVKAQLGVKTKTGDSEGEIISKRAVPSFSQADILKSLQHFLGASTQIPPMYSALKVHGQPLYKLARQNKEVARVPRAIKIYDINLIHYAEEVIEFTVHCSKGTYIRTLVEDLGELLGCGAHVIYLHRIAVGQFNSANMISIDELKALYDEKNPEALDYLLLSTIETVKHLPFLILDEERVRLIRCGQKVNIEENVNQGLVVLKTASGELLGIGEVDNAGKIAPRRLVKV